MNTATACNIALNIPLILSRILSHLELKELKVTRQVNSLWRKEAHPHFLQLAVGTIKISEGDDPSSYTAGYPTYLHQNIRIHTIHNILEQKSIVASLISTYGTHIRCLSLQFTCPYNMTLLSDYTFLNDVLSNVLNLNELTLTIPNCHMHNKEATEDDAFNTWFPDKVHKLTNLKTLNITITVTSRSLFVVFMAMVKKIFELGPNLRSLNVNVYGMDRRLNEDCLLMVTDHRDIMPMLEEVHLTPISWDRELNSLLRIDLPLKRISLGSVNSTYVKTIQAILEKHSNTLESFKLEIYNSNPMTTNNVPCSDFVLPNLSKLKILTLTYSYTRANPLDDIVPAPPLRLLDPLNLWFLFGIQGTRYEPTMCDKLPHLHTLSLSISDPENSGPEFSSFFYDGFFLGVGDETKFPQVRYLTVSYPKNPTSLEYMTWTRKLATMFPNVHNEHVNSGRQLSNKNQRYTRSPLSDVKN